MADAPTTTDKQIITERSPSPITLRWGGRLYRDGEFYALEVAFNLGSEEKTALFEERRFGEAQMARLRVPAAEFGGNDGEASEWAQEVIASLETHLGSALLREAISSVADEGAASLGERVGPGPTIDFKATIEAHIRATKKRLYQRFGLRAEGQSSPWKRDELAAAVMDAAALLPPAERTYARVAGLLKRSHPDKAPESAEALRKLVNRFKLDWRELKTGDYIVFLDEDIEA